MVTLCSVQDVLDRCGVNANAAIIASAAIVERYITVSEGILVAETRQDYVGSFGNLSSGTLNDAKSFVASHAAKQIIMQDTSGFTTVASGVSKANANINEYSRALRSLKETDSNKIRSISA